MSTILEHLNQSAENPNDNRLLAAIVRFESIESPLAELKTHADQRIPLLNIARLLNIADAETPVIAKRYTDLVETTEDPKTGIVFAKPTDKLKQAAALSGDPAVDQAAAISADQFKKKVRETSLIRSAMMMTLLISKNTGALS